MVAALAAGGASSDAQRDFVRRLNACCAVRLYDSNPAGAGLVRDWTLHETHVRNALLVATWIPLSLAAGLGGFLGLDPTSYDPLTLQLDEGDQVSRIASYLPRSSQQQYRARTTMYQPIARRRRTTS